MTTQCEENSLRTRWVIGCMTGTSLDGLDAALVKLTGVGMNMSAQLHGWISLPLSESLRNMLQQFACGQTAPALDYVRAARQLGDLYSSGVGALLRDYPLPDDAQLDFVVAHGQTIWHEPKEQLSWQLFDPWPIVREHGAAVCYDLRQADLIAGGQGAPLTPIADPILYRMDRGMVFNFGGICNVTRWTEEAGNLTGADIYPCNLLLDGLVQQLFPGKRYDENGQIARGASVERSAVHRIEKTIQTAVAQCQSLGREQFHRQWLHSLIEQLLPSVMPQQIIAAATEAIAMEIVRQIDEYKPSGVIFAGGGARNIALTERIRELCKVDIPLQVSDAVGIPCEAREAMAFAVLGALSADGIPVSLPQVTGATNPGVAGCWVGK